MTGLRRDLACALCILVLPIAAEARDAECLAAEARQAGVLKLGAADLPAALRAQELQQVFKIRKETRPGARARIARDLAASAQTRAQDLAAALQTADGSELPGRCLTVPVLQRQYAGLQSAVDSIGAALGELRRDDVRVSDLDLLGARQRVAGDALRLAATRLASRSAQYGFYLGPSFSQDGSGGWKSGVEVLARFDPEAGTPEDSVTCTKPFIWCRAFSEFSYQVIGAVDAAVAEATGGVTPAAGETLPFNPFSESGGYFRFNGGLRGHFSEWFGLQAGVGLSSLPNEDGGDHRLVPRYFGGFDFQTLYGDGALGQIFIGYARDEFWERRIEQDGSVKTLRDFDRYVVSGTFLLPGVEAIGFRVATRAHLDAPVSGEGPSETRVAILFYQDFSGWLDLFNPLKALEP